MPRSPLPPPARRPVTTTRSSVVVGQSPLRRLRRSAVGTNTPATTPVTSAGRTLSEAPGTAAPATAPRARDDDAQDERDDEPCVHVAMTSEPMRRARRLMAPPVGARTRTGR